jgi:hypothetical protein
MYLLNELIIHYFIKLHFENPLNREVLNKVQALQLRKLKSFISNYAGIKSSEILFKGKIFKKLCTLIYFVTIKFKL